MQYNRVATEGEAFDEMQNGRTHDGAPNQRHPIEPPNQAWYADGRRHSPTHNAILHVIQKRGATELSACRAEPRYESPPAFLPGKRRLDLKVTNQNRDVGYDYQILSLAKDSDLAYNR